MIADDLAFFVILAFLGSGSVVMEPEMGINLNVGPIGKEHQDV